MIWATENIMTNQQPAEASVQLVGHYIPDGCSALITITLDIDHISKYSRGLFEKRYSSMIYEEPDPEDVAARFASKFEKFRNNISSLDWDVFLQKYGPSE